MKKIRMLIAFGQDQEVLIDKLLIECGRDGHVKSFKKRKLRNKRLQYDIYFSDAFGIYSFGFKQGRLQPPDILANYLQ